MRAFIWIKAVNESVKFNVDGAYKDGKAGCEGILKNTEGDVIAMFSSIVSDLGAYFAELMAIRVALKVFVDAGLKCKFALIMDSDSQESKEQALQTISTHKNAGYGNNIWRGRSDDERRNAWDHRISNGKLKVEVEAIREEMVEIVAEKG
ncbi:hypothetical protein V6N13_038216 [Hibiscus sabdariffa]